ncbi:hypothetical protein BKA60DRAFT_328664 [Fusarium oxysporum]|nr:hypothetical protein BKA60DRAFT_328664 [Fusarium oxysporum]
MPRSLLASAVSLRIESVNRYRQPIPDRVKYPIPESGPGEDQEYASVAEDTIRSMFNSQLKLLSQLLSLEVGKMSSSDCLGTEGTYRNQGAVLISSLRCATITVPFLCPLTRRP